MALTLHRRASLLGAILIDSRVMAGGGLAQTAPRTLVAARDCGA